MNVWFHSNDNDWEDKVTKILQESGIWHNVYNSNWNKKNNPFAVNDYFRSFDGYDTRILPSSLLNKLTPYLYKFIEMYSRNSKNDQNSYHDFTIHEYLNLFNLILQYYYYQYTEQKIDLVFFNRAPHVGFDYLSYHLAEKMGIKTLILEQSKFPNRFFYYWKHKDYGTFNTSRIKFKHPFVEIETKFEKDLIYMKNINKNKIYTRRGLYKNYPFLKLVRELFDKDLRSGAFSKYYKTLEFEKNKHYLEVSDEKIDLNTPFIYFGLHYQPEKTTSSWGGKYTDQLLALEHLSSILPENWKIYVKENPKQGYFMRDKLFYKRLHKIPNTILVSQNTNTYTLLKKCQMGATITGTIGWECITGGKPVIYFGWGTWYKTFHGAYEFNENLDLLSVVKNFKPLSKTEIETKINSLLDYTGQGVIYNKGYYKDLLEDYNPEKNIENIATSLKKILTE